MKKQKLKLDELELESFSTMNAGDPDTIKGGLPLLSDIWSLQCCPIPPCTCDCPPKG